MVRIYKSPYPTPERVPGSLFNYLWSNPYGVDDSKLLFVSPEGQGWTRGGLRESVHQLAYALRHNLGLAPRTVIAIFSPNSIDYPLIVNGAECAGLRISPCNAAYTADELAFQLADSGTQVLFAHPGLLNTAVQALRKAGWTEKDIKDKVWVLDPSGSGKDKNVRTIIQLAGGKKLEPHPVDNPEDETLFLSYSSGTSGRPKGVELTHRNLTSVLSMMWHGFKRDRWTDKDRTVVALPFYHIFALTKIVHLAILFGFTTVVLPKFDLEEYCKAIQKHKATISIVVPPICVLLAKDPRVAKYDLTSLRLLIVGAAPFSGELAYEVKERIEVLPVQGYGLTETSPTTHYMPTEDFQPGSIGYLFPGLEARLVQDDGTDAAPGHPGELWLRGPSVMKAYLNNPTATAESIDKDRFFHTGDIAVIKNDLYYIVDRKKELIKYKGVQVAPAELEALVLTHPDVADVAVMGVYDASQATELPRAYVVPRGGLAAYASVAKREALAKSVSAFVAERAANHKKLRGGVVAIESIPKSSSGKILRRVLRDQMAKDEKAAKAKL